MAIDYDNRLPQPPHRAEDVPPDLAAGSYDARVTCPNCGAEFSADEARCPYCGTLNPSGAEKAYMDTLEDIREDTDDLVDDTQDAFKSNLRGNTKKVVSIAIAVAAVIALLFFASTCAEKNDEQQAVKEYQAREAFRSQYFAEFDRLYEAGDDETLSEYVWSLTDDPGFDALFSWEHADYLEVHDDWEMVRLVEIGAESGECDIDDYTWGVERAFRLVQLDSYKDPSVGLSPDEETRAAKYRADAQLFLERTLQMNQQEIEAFADAARDSDGHIERDRLKENLRARLRELGVI